MAKVEIKRLDIISVAKIQAVVMAIIGFIIGLFVVIFASIATVFAGAVGSMLPGVGTAVGFGFLAIIILPIVYGIIGFIFGVIWAFLYNVVAARIGGVVFESKK